MSATGTRTNHQAHCNTYKTKSCALLLRVLLSGLRIWSTGSSITGLLAAEPVLAVSLVADTVASTSSGTCRGAVADIPFKLLGVGFRDQPNLCAAAAALLSCVAPLRLDWP